MYVNSPVAYFGVDIDHGTVILNASLVASAGGIRILSQVLYEGPYELSETLSLAFLYLLDMPTTRQYIRAGHDMEVRVSITHTYTNIHRSYL